MKTGSTYQTKQNFAVLLVGEQKTGKTNLAMSFPDPWFLDCDRNIARAARVVKNKVWFFDDPYVDDKGTELPTEKRWNNAVAQLKAAAKAPEVKTLVIDGLAALADMLVAHIIHEVKTSEGKVIDRLRIQDYQPLKTLMTNLVMGLRSSGKLLVFTSHQKGDKDEMTGRMRYTINMPGSLSENFGGFFSDVWATTSGPVVGKPGEVKYEMHTKPTGFHINLGTSLDLPAIIDCTNKTPDQIWAVIGPKVLGT